MYTQKPLWGKILFFFFPLFLWFFLYLLITEGCSESFDSARALKTAETKLKEETERYALLQEKIQKERLPLVEKNRILEEEINELKNRFSRLKTLQNNSSLESGDLQSRLSVHEKKITELKTVVETFISKTLESLTLAEKPVYGPSLEKIRTAFSLSPAWSAKTSKTINELFTLTHSFLLEKSGISILSGKAADSHGTVYEGNFYQWGPYALFLDSAHSFLAPVDPSSGIRHILLEKELSPKTIPSFLKGEPLSVPLDMTLGSAKKIRQLKKPFMEYLKAGGIVMIPILSLGVLCLLTALWKYCSLKNLSPFPSEVIDRTLYLYQSKDIENLNRVLNRIPFPLQTLLKEIYFAKNFSKDQIKNTIDTLLFIEIPGLEKGLKIFSLSASTAPLLGLLGTVTGMIHTFDIIGIFGTGRVNLLSGGISEALITTEYGLYVAIPAFLLHSFFTREIKHFLDRTESTLQMLTERL